MGRESVYLFLEFTINTKTNPLNPPCQGDFDKCLLISRVYYNQPKLLVIGNPSEPVGRDSHLDTKTSILENRPTKMIQFAQGLWTIGLNMLATSNLR